MFAVPVGGRGFYQTLPNEVEHTIENPDVKYRVEKEKGKWEGKGRKRTNVPKDVSFANLVPPCTQEPTWPSCHGGFGKHCTT